VVEKRRAIRFPMVLPVILKKAMESEARTLTREVSSGGVYFEGSEAPAPGSRLEFTLTLPTEVPRPQGPVQIRCVGKVVRVDHGFGGQVGVAATIDRYEFLPNRSNHIADDLSDGA
jgi:hypothetical protein